MLERSINEAKTGFEEGNKEDSTNVPSDDLVLLTTQLCHTGSPLYLFLTSTTTQIPRFTRHHFIDFLLFLPFGTLLRFPTAFGILEEAPSRTLEPCRVARVVVDGRLGELDEAVNRVGTSCRA